MKIIKKLPLPVLILIISFILGLIFAGIGLIRQNNAKVTNQERYEAAYKQSQEKVDKANARLAEIETELATLEEQYSAKQKECNSINTSDSNWFTNKTNCTTEATKIYTQITELETEKWSLQYADYTVYYQMVKPMAYLIFYILGGGIFVLGAIGALIIYLSKGKKK